MYAQLWPALNEIDLAVKNVENWMKDESRTADAILSMKAMRELSDEQRFCIDFISFAGEKAAQRGCLGESLFWCH